MTHAERVIEARRSLRGLRIGDCFGERFFVNPASAQLMIEQRALAAGPWPFTDDTDMAVGIVNILERHERILSDELALEFGRRYRLGSTRGYGSGAAEILQKVNVGIPWREASGDAFNGTGSLGNGAAMRAAPLGAYFWDDDDRLFREATLAAEVTHLNPDGIAGGVAIAAAAAFMRRTRATTFIRSNFFDFVYALTPVGPTRDGIKKAAGWPNDATPSSAAGELGSGQRVFSMDTVPYTLWCMARHPDDYEEALWATVAGFGDRDTTCAIVGGCVILRDDDVPAEWEQSAEAIS